MVKWKQIGLYICFQIHFLNEKDKIWLWMRQILMKSPCSHLFAYQFPITVNKKWKHSSSNHLYVQVGVSSAFFHIINEVMIHNNNKNAHISEYWTVTWCSVEFEGEKPQEMALITRTSTELNQRNTIRLHIYFVVCVSFVHFNKKQADTW